MNADYDISGVWQHNAGGLYRVICVCRHALTGEYLVVAESIHSGRMYARNRQDWLDNHHQVQF